MPGPADTADLQTRFAEALGRFDLHRPVLLMFHNDVDGLAAGALLARAFRAAGREVRTRILGRGENPWSDAIREEVQRAGAGGLVAADLGVRAGPIAPGLPTIILDHHVPLGVPGDAVVISGYGIEPTPTSSLLAFWCAQSIADVDALLWIAAIGVLGDLGEKAPFETLAAARKRHSLKALREATSLLNAPRRAAAGDAGPAFQLLMKAEGPAEITSREHPETALLQAARQEVKAALDAGKRVAPRIVGDVALIRLHSPCQIHPLVAQTWRGRLKDQIVIAANTGYRPGWVHFAARSATGRNLIQFLREHAPAGADENYGSGHEQATGGALRPEAWNDFIAGLGFGPEARAA